jgi:hypothetical protein
MSVGEATPGDVPGEAADAPWAGDRDRRQAAMVGHRLPNGQLSVHPPGYPCPWCGAVSAAARQSARHRKQRVSRGWFGRPRPADPWMARS